MNADIKIVVMVTKDIIRIMEIIEEGVAEDTMVVEATKDTIVMNLSSFTLEEEAEVNMEATEVMVVMEVSGVMEEATEIPQETGIKSSNKGITIQTMEADMVIRQIIEEDIID